jgi:four helix bundle protein
MVESNFKNLDVYKKAFSIALAIHKKSLGFPDIEKFALSSQMRRASKGICANIAEGYTKQIVSKAEFRRFMHIAMGSANEMIVWTDFCYELGYITNEEAKLWSNEFLGIAKMINKLAQ